MTERIPKSAIVGAVIVTLIGLTGLAYFRPGYFTSLRFLGGLLVAEFLFVAIRFYRQIFLPIVLLAFLFAGSALPLGGIWTQGRWLLLAVGALVGLVVVLKGRPFRFGLFHAMALFAILAGVVSSAASRYPGVAFLKIMSLFLLFIYAATGARLAVVGREGRFFSGLLISCELFVAAMAVFQLLGISAMGNPNSLGAVTGVVCCPLLLWGALVDNKTAVRYRRFTMFVICALLVYQSQARAGLAAVLVSCGLLCLALREYRLLAGGVSVILILAASIGILQPETFSTGVSSVTSSVLYKGKDPGAGFLASRREPWRAAMDSIRTHFWFGTGFGTADNGPDVTERLSLFRSSLGVTKENGSSYLAILTWVGVMGALPFLMTLLLLLGYVARTLSWMWKHRSSSHPAIPLAMVVIGGLVHASLEDWLFATGYYLCVFFWCVAFVFVDLAPARLAPDHSLASAPKSPALLRQNLAGVMPGR